MGRRWVSAVLAVLAVLAGAAPVRASAENPVRLRVMSYNIQAGAGMDRVFDLERTAKAIEEQDADVVALQEVDSAWSKRSDYVDEPEWLAKRLGMRVFYAPIYTLPPDRPGAPDRKFGVAILSRHRILTARNYEITRLSTQVPNPVPEPAPGFPEALIVVRGFPLWIYDTHLDYRSDPAIRQMQVRDMMEIMRHRSGRKLLLGDFNAPPAAPELAPLWQRFHDALTETANGDQPTWPSNAPAKRIDYVTHSAGVRTATARVPVTLASDHLPVVADLVLTRGRASKSRQ